jgi:hypothetical protein
VVRVLLSFDFLSSLFFSVLVWSHPLYPPSFTSHVPPFSLVVILGTMCPSSSSSPLLDLSRSSISISVCLNPNASIYVL